MQWDYAAAAKSLQSCLTVRPRRWQPIRLPRPWDSLGKNTGVGCHFLLQCMKVQSESEVTQSCLTLHDPMGCSLPGSSVHGIFQARVMEWGAIAFSGIWGPWRPKFNYKQFLKRIWQYHRDYKYGSIKVCNCYFRRRYQTLTLDFWPPALWRNKFLLFHLKEEKVHLHFIADEKIDFMFSQSHVRFHEKILMS